MSYVTFESGAHIAWHNHPLDNTLIVTSSSCRVQRQGESIEDIPSDDVILLEMEEKIGTEQLPPPQ